jgi:hypothetical protein
MLDDIRNHDPAATKKERDWMDASPVELAVRFVALVSLSIAIGIAASPSLDPEPAPRTAAAQDSR